MCSFFSFSAEKIVRIDTFMLTDDKIRVYGKLYLIFQSKVESVCVKYCAYVCIFLPYLLCTMPFHDVVDHGSPQRLILLTLSNTYPQLSLLIIALPSLGKVIEITFCSTLNTLERKARYRINKQKL